MNRTKKSFGGEDFGLGLVEDGGKDTQGNSNNEPPTAKQTTAKPAPPQDTPQPSVVVARVKRSYQQVNYQRVSDDGEVELRQFSFLLRDDIKTKLAEIAFRSKPKKSVALLINEMLAEKLAEKNYEATK